MGRWIEADRKTQCARCRARIEIGDTFWYARKGTYMCEQCGSLAEHEEPEVGEVESGVMEDLKQLPPEASDRTLARLALKLAKSIDGGDVADRDIAPMIKEIRAILVQLKENFPAEPEDDETEKARKSRARRLMLDDDPVS